ncbi:MAG TPA: hypothetical protein ENN46_00930 [Candidatus Woesearchaeota archaeon]|nr:hypothetical protein [Candidatus Woesearchaeota archaeon]
MKLPGKSKKAVFNVYTLAFAILAFTLALMMYLTALNFVDSFLSGSKRLELSSQFSSSESLKYYLDKAVAIESRSASFELNSQGGTDSECHTYQGFNLWNSLDEEKTCFSPEKMRTLFSSKLSESLKKHYISYPYEFIPALNYSVSFDAELLSAYPTESIFLKDYYLGIYLFTGEEVLIQVPFEYSGKQEEDALKVPEKLFFYYLILNNEAKKRGVLFVIDGYDVTTKCLHLKQKGVYAENLGNSEAYSELSGAFSGASERLLINNIEIKENGQPYIPFCLRP